MHGWKEANKVVKKGKTAAEAFFVSYLHFSILNGAA
jgi:hypothetical protein